MRGAKGIECVRVAALNVEGPLADRQPEHNAGEVAILERKSPMKTTASRLVRIVRDGVGLALVLSAVGATAFARGPSLAAPEIDPGSIGSALTLLTGGVMLLTGRRS